MSKKYDFCGWATRANVKCSDGRTILNDAFKDNDGQTVPLVWNHQHNEPWNVLGHALLENRGDGVYMYGTFNDTESGKDAKLIVQHGDVTGLSIYANKLRQVNGNVLHGEIREVSLVLAGANPNAKIESVLSHAEPDIFIEDILEHNDDAGDSAIVYNFNASELDLYHAEEEQEEAIEHAEDEKETEVANENEKKEGKTVKEVFDSLTDEQREAVNTVVAYILEENESEDKDEEGDSDMAHAFENNDNNNDYITHAEMMDVIGDSKKFGSMKESALQHGIEGIDYLFPEDKSLTPMPPEMINKNVEWVDAVLNGVHHTPFSRVKSMYADIREDEARAKGYIKGKQKKTEVFSLLKRSTSPQTVYKLQKFDRDDVIDITDFDVVAWVKGEMRQKLNEELARAILIGDGRLASDDDHISEDHIRPVFNDANLYTIKRNITVPQNATEDEIARLFERESIKSRKDYRGSGNPTLFTTEDFLTTMLLREDNIGRRIHSTEAELATALRVSKIVTCSEMENMKGALGGDLVGIIVNLADYTVGADKGGAVNLFDDFDIDFNKMAYLIETRCSGALVKPYSAITIELNGTAASSTDYDPTGSKGRGVQVTKGMGDSTVPYPWENNSSDDEGGEG